MLCLGNKDLFFEIFLNYLENYPGDLENKFNFSHSSTPVFIKNEYYLNSVIVIVAVNLFSWRVKFPSDPVARLIIESGRRICADFIFNLAIQNKTDLIVVLNFGAIVVVVFHSFQNRQRDKFNGSLNLIISVNRIIVNISR